MFIVSNCLLILSDLCFLNYSEVEILVELETFIPPVEHPICKTTEPHSKLTLLPAFTRISRAVLVQALESYRSVRDNHVPFFHKWYWI